MADQTDRDAVAATLAAHTLLPGGFDATGSWLLATCTCGWDTADQHAPHALHAAHLADVLAPLLAQARAEADTHREVAESMTGLWHAERDRADRLEAMCDRLAERLAVLPDLWRKEGRGVMFNRDGGDLTPQGRVGKWLHDKTKVTDFRAAVAEGKEAGRG